MQDERFEALVRRAKLTVMTSKLMQVIGHPSSSPLRLPFDAYHGQIAIN
jgi:hypothetical protein